MSITATISHSTAVDSWGDTLNHYVIALSNGITVKRQASAKSSCPEGANCVTISLRTGTVVTASVNIRRIFRKFKGAADVVAAIDRKGVGRLLTMSIVRGEARLEISLKPMDLARLKS